VSFSDEITRVLIVTASLALPVYIAAGATLALAAVLIPLCRRTWLNKRSFSWLGVFYRQRSAGYLRAACSWVKLLMLLILLVLLARGRVLGLSDYLMLVLPGILYAALSKSPSAIIGKFMWTALETVGLLAVGILRSYVTEMNPGTDFVLVYALLSVFMGIFGVYVFLRELHAVSTERGRGFNV
jgi:hypothetical protein